VPPAATFSGGPPTNAAYNADDMAIMQAQKHAKWAISALNFEDVPTAVRELKSALAVLGAS
jgi:vacuolar protein sorting-associated protein VTA1